MFNTTVPNSLCMDLILQDLGTPCSMSNLELKIMSYRYIEFRRKEKFDKWTNTLDGIWKNIKQVHNNKYPGWNLEKY